MSSEKYPQSDWEPSETILPEYKGIAEAIRLIDEVLLICTGLNDFQRRLVGYFAVSTYYISQYSVFPGFMPYGSTSSGKSQILDVLYATCNKPSRLTEKTSTEAALRAAMKASNGGTLILEEAGELRMEDIEGVLTTRYSKSAARTAKMVREGDEGAHELENPPTFGATVIHRQFSIRKPMLQRRMISVHTIRQQRAQPFVKFLELDEKADGIDPETFMKRVHDCLADLPEVPRIRQQWEGVEPGVLDTYKPVIAVATALEDEAFIEEVIHEVRDKSAELREDETSLELPTILRTILLLVVQRHGEVWLPERLSIDVSDIEPAIRKEYGNSHPALLLSHTQRNRIIRSDFGFKVDSSGGKVKVFLTLGLLVKVCDRYGVQDDTVEFWRKEGR